MTDTLTTQRVNLYISGAGLTVFEIEQYNPELHEWFNIGGTYDKVEHAQAAADRHNLKELTDKLFKLKETT